MRRPVVLLALFACGCPYITRRAYETERADLDEDGDGAVWADDCDDRDPEKSPDIGETPYDGIDNDCDGQDLVDVDGDGFPGIDEAAYDAQAPEVPFPDALRDKVVDCADDPAVVPTAASVYPDATGAIEVPYDGIDGDCQGDNDFDADRDGYMPDVVEIAGVEVTTDVALADYLAAWGLDAADWGPGGVGAPSRDDCDDTDAEVNPGATIPEVWYDGVDRNCDDHNDFDQDGDGFMPAAAQGEYELYVARYYGDDPPPFVVDAKDPYGDCLDELDPTKLSFPDDAPAAPGDVYPGAPDAPYDAIDADCGADNDFDADQDGFVPDVVSGQPTLTVMADYADTWGYGQEIVDGWASVNPDAGLTTPTDGDCDDDDRDSWPGALDLLADGLDQDCDGAADAAPFGFGDAAGDFDWTAPTNPEVVRVGDAYLVMAGATSAYLPSYADNVGAGIPFLLEDARGPAVPSGNYAAWKSPNLNLAIQGRMDAVLEPNPADTDGDGLPDPVVRTVSNSSNIATTGYTYLNVGGIEFRSATRTVNPLAAGTTFVSDSYTGLGLDVVADPDGGVLAIACALEVTPGGFLNASYFQPYAVPSVANDVVLDTVQGDTCFYEDEPTQVGASWVADFTLCALGVCESWAVDDAPSFTGPTPSAESWVYGDYDDGWTALIDPTGAGWLRDAAGGPDLRAFPTDPVQWLDVSEWKGTLYAAAILNGQVWLQHGTAGNFDFVQIPFDDPSVDGEVPRSVAVHADGDRVALAVVATTGVPDRDSVGWVFLGPPP